MKSPRKLLIFSLLAASVAALAAVPNLASREEARRPNTQEQRAMHGLSTGRQPPSLARANVKLLEQRDDALTIEWQCPGLRVSRDEATGAVTALDLAGAESVTEVGVPRLPALLQLVDCYPGPVTASIVDVEVETQNLGRMLPMPEDRPVDLPPDEDGSRGGPLDEFQNMTFAERQAATPLREGVWPPQQLVTGEAGVYRGHRLVSVQLYPVQVNAREGIAQVIKRARIRIHRPRPSQLETRQADAPNETALVQDLLGALGSTALSTRVAAAERQGGGSLDDGPIGGRWKLLVNTEGIIRVDRALLDSVGVPADQITPFDTHIFNRGAEVPIYFSGEADGHFDAVDYIDFYGVPNRQTFQADNPAAYQDPWTDQNVYWLSWGDGRPGLRMGQMTVGWHDDWPVNEIHTLTSVRNQVHAEQDQHHDRLAQSAEENRHVFELYGPLGLHDDHWFWGARMDGLTTRNFPISLPFPNTRSFRVVKVRAALQGFSYQTGVATGRHRAIVFLNGITAPGLAVGPVIPNDPHNVDWHNQTPLVFETTSDSIGVTTDQLVDGLNTLSVTLPGDGLDGAADKIYVNWFEVEYDRELRASRHFIAFDFDTTRADTYAIDVRGFASSDIELWDLAGAVRLTGADIRRVTPADESPSEAARFHLITTRAFRFHFFDSAHPVRPVDVTPEVSTVDWRQQTGAHYLMIYHDTFTKDDLGLASLARLDSLRRASFQGSVLSVPLSAVYEQFSGGVVNPYAIRDFLRYAYNNWPVRPTHCCLIGDGVMLNRGYHGPGDLIPPLYAETFGKTIGICAADMLYGCVSGPEWDLLPDVAVGRISARTGFELQGYVDKLLAYETASDFTGLFRSTVMFVADQHSDYDFARVFSEPIIAVLPDTLNVWRVYLDSLATGQGPGVLRDAWRSPGAVIVNYNGHGGGGVWSNANLMNVADVRLLRNRRAFPFITNFTCFVGAFDDRSQTAVLGEAFLFTRNNDGDLVGGVGVYSSSGVGWAFTGINMQRYLFDFAASRPGGTLGGIIVRSKTRFWAANTVLNPRWASSSGSDVPYSQLVMMNLLGDPGLRLSLPESDLSPLGADTAVVTPGDSVHVSYTLPWTPDATAPTNLYALPYNGDRFRTFVYYDSVRHDSVRQVLLTSSKVPVFDPATVTATPTISATGVASLMIGPRFITPDGHIVVYAVDRGQQRSAIGVLPIYRADSLNRVRVLDVATVPPDFIRSDSTFAVRARIVYRSGLERVKLRGVFRPAQGPLEVDTCEMSEIAAGLWESALVGPHHTVGGSYQATFEVKPADEDWVTTDAFPVPVEQYTDLLIDPGDIHHPAVLVPELRGGERPFLYIPITHRRYVNQRPVDSVEVQVTGVGDTSSVIWPDTSAAADSFTVRQWVAIPGEVTSLSEAFVPVVLRPRAYQFTITLDPDNRVIETDETNNTTQLTVTMPQIYAASNMLGTYYLRPLQAQALHRQQGTGDTLWLAATAESVPTPWAAFVYSGPVSMSVSEQVRLASQSLYPPVGNRAPRVFTVMLWDSSDALTNPAQVNVIMNLNGVLGSVLPQVSVFGKRHESPNWTRLDSTRLDTVRFDTLTQRYDVRVHGIARGLGDFALFRSADLVGPLVDFSADGIHLTRGSILPRRPIIYAALSDVNGIDRRPGHFFAVLDGDTLPSGEISWNDTLESGGGMCAVIRPQLEAGQHVLRVIATDNIGNTAQADVTFEVRGQFGIEWAINYPNPFANNTRISYLLTDVTDHPVVVKIYTVSGRRIRTLRESDATVVSYRTFDWDGRDDAGEVVANGVYFARLFARQGDHEVEKTIKMAKVR